MLPPFFSWETPVSPPAALPLIPFLLLYHTSAPRTTTKYKNPALHHTVRDLRVLLQAKPLVEPINTSTGVNQLLLAGIERVALGADLNTNVLLGRTSGKDIAARAADGGLFVLGMDTFLHFVHLFLIS